MGFWLIIMDWEVEWWRQTESNRRHKDFQSFALPTELWSQLKDKMSV